MSTLKVHVDMDLCQSHGECVFAAPDVFELDDEDVLSWKNEVDESKRAELEDAANLCPMMAIRIEG